MRKLILVAALMAAAFVLSGCSVGKVEYSPNATKRATLHFIGVPTVLGAVGSSTPLNASYSLTAAHVADTMPQLDVVARHPYCDVALIREHNAAGYILPQAQATVGAPVDLLGYSARTALPVAGKGVVKRTVRLEGLDGKHSCPAMATSAGGMQGMSGGPAVQGGKLVGIMIAINVNTSETVFVPLQSIQLWLDEVTNVPRLP